VALGSNENLKGINTGDNVMGAEFVTPMGIAVTGVMNKGYDFSVISLNDKSIRIFNTNKITVFELLSMAGHKSAEILGRSGHSLSYTLNGERKTVRGGGFEPAVVTLGGNPVALSEKISGGDKVDFVPAICGENAKLLLKDAVPKFSEQEVTVNGEKKDGDYSVQNLDKIETFLLEEEEVGNSDPDIPTSASAPMKEIIVETDISVVLNGTKIEMPQNDEKLPHTFFELFNYADMDIEKPPNPRAEYVMLLNNEPASFNDELKDGDDAILKWKE
jgi:molybdopterin converting factor small subunit